MGWYQTSGLPNTRIDVADALRGIAVAGIIAYHSVEHFDIFTEEPIVHTLACDQTVGNVLAWLLSGKMYGIFAMLFGLSFFIMNDNQQQKGRSFAGRFAWRMCLLFVFGVINVAFYDGDILMLYAVYGLLLIPISYLPSWAVWCIIGVLAIQPVELYRLLTGTTIDNTRLFDIYNRTIALHEHGSFWENAVNNVRYGFELNLRYNVYSGRLTQLLCLFILGMQLGRQRLFYRERPRKGAVMETEATAATDGRNVATDADTATNTDAGTVSNLPIWHGVLVVSAVAVGVLSVVDFGVLKPWLTPIYNLMILLMTVAGVVSAWDASKGVRRALSHLCTFGRMSLTNYLLQSVIGSFIFCGYGLACYRLVGITYAVMIGLGMVVCQYCFCRWWFSSHPRGPLEGLWRRLTWIGAPSNSPQGGENKLV